MAAVARIVSQRTYSVSGKIRITEYHFEVPRDWSSPATSPPLTLFARASRRQHKPADPTGEDKTAGYPWMAFLQGGPGFGCAFPQASSWATAVMDRGYQVLCLDQRGTGLSEPVSASALGLRGDERTQAAYLRAFRADSIVRDCEAVRRALTAGWPPEKQKWSILGQSYGGFCATTYLSIAPEGLREAFVFGGLQPLVDQPDEVYRATFKRVIKRNEAYYNKFPEDVEKVQKIVAFLQRAKVRDTSDTGYMTARRFLQLGLDFGFHGGFEIIHDVILRADNDLKFFGHLTKPTVARIEFQLPFNEAIIFSILHESIYCSGKASNWSAWRIWKENEHIFRVPDKFNTGDAPVYFTGEMIFPWMFDDYSELRQLKEQAEMIAQIDDWPPLFDIEQLKRNKVPVYAAAYWDDMYVDFDLSMKTAETINGCKTYITNMMYHDALRSKVDEVVKALFSLRDDTID